MDENGMDSGIMMDDYVIQFYIIRSLSFMRWWWWWRWWCLPWPPRLVPGMVYYRRWVINHGNGKLPMAMADFPCNLPRKFATRAWFSHQLLEPNLPSSRWISTGGYHWCRIFARFECRRVMDEAHPRCFQRIGRTPKVGWKKFWPARIGS